VVDGNITTGWGLGAAIPFALELARQLEGEEAAEHVRAGIDYVH
jgi:4-methyl-5(b-hydroxyethyl)-thiazole monophosphate biosynthesis